MRIVTILALMCLGFAASARAWGPDGHRIVCAIAWDELTPAARARVVDILHVGTRAAFADACTWADDYTAAHKETAAWHFVNVPPDATAVDAARDCALPRSCVVAQIDQDIAALHDGTAADPAATLRFLGHFVGDVHQPLHVSYAADRGGNDFKGNYFQTPTNLHLVWDFGLLEHDGRSWEQIADALHQAVSPPERRDLTQAQVLDWANESLAIAQQPSTGYVPHGETFDLGDDYTRTNLPIALERLKRAGIRLGATLNGVFP